MMAHELFSVPVGALVHCDQIDGALYVSPDAGWMEVGADGSAIRPFDLSTHVGATFDIVGNVDPEKPAPSIAWLLSKP